MVMPIARYVRRSVAYAATRLNYRQSTNRIASDAQEYWADQTSININQIPTGKEVAVFLIPYGLRSGSCTENSCKMQRLLSASTCKAPEFWNGGAGAVRMQFNSWM